MIKDSGDRTEFETGAKRDMHAGKGRMHIAGSRILSSHSILSDFASSVGDFHLSSSSGCVSRWFSAQSRFQQAARR